MRLEPVLSKASPDGREKVAVVPNPFKYPEIVADPANTDTLRFVLIKYITLSLLSDEYTFPDPSTTTPNGVACK
jgi:hypothetical protein